MDVGWIWDQAIKFAKWQHHAICRGEVLFGWHLLYYCFLYNALLRILL